MSTIWNFQGSVGQGGVNHPDDVLAVKQRLLELGFDWINADTVINQETIQTIRLFQSIINGRNTVSGDGRIDVNGPTFRWLQATNAPKWQLMPVGSQAEGFSNVERAEVNDHHDYGTDWMAQIIKDAGATYKHDFLDPHAQNNPRPALLTINDVSLPHGGDTPDHDGHETGLACDLRLPRMDGTAPGDTTWQTATYDRQTTRAMITAIRKQSLVTRVFFNDIVLVTENLCQTLNKHDNHVHFEIKPPVPSYILTKAH